jgi:hypothetical protein
MEENQTPGCHIVPQTSTGYILVEFGQAGSQFCLPDPSWSHLVNLVKHNPKIVLKTPAGHSVPLDPSCSHFCLHGQAGSQLVTFWLSLSI